MLRHILYDYNFIVTYGCFTRGLIVVDKYKYINKHLTIFLISAFNYII